MLTPTPVPLPGSSFQGADGDQDDAPPRIDWQALQAAEAVLHVPDPNQRDNAIKGKELAPGGWEVTEEIGGVNPAKDNIRDAYAAVRQPGANTFLYLGFTREQAGGTTFLAFELNTDGQLWDNDGDARTPPIPCRRTGDVLISFEPHGNEIEVVIQRWITDDTGNVGCAKTGSLDEYTRFTPNVDAQGAMNEAAIASRLPGASSGTVGPDRFGETALNLAKILDQAFGDRCLSYRSFWMHSRSSSSGVQSAMQDYVAPQPLDVRTCSASGTKFFDRDADGVRDREDPGIPRFLIFADYDDDGELDRREPRTVSDNQGQYVLYDIRPPDGTYRLRETLLIRRTPTLPVATDWICSYPQDGTPGGGTGSAPGGRFPCGWGPFDPDLMPDVRGRDFGNWFPARLTLEKEIEPAGDPGRFDLLVNGRVVIPAAGDGARRTISVPPGVYDVSEIPVAGSGEYRSTVECRRNVTSRGGSRSGAAFDDIALFAGDQATCTFRNIRTGSPAIAIRKAGPALAEAGDTLAYTLYVTNPGDVPFPAAAVVVRDPDCGAPPELVEKQRGSGADGTPRTLDPGDTWVYRCSRRTTDPGNTCEPSRVPNSATVTGTVDGTTVEDEDSISTILLCRDVPPKPPPPEPPAPEPGPEPGPGPEPSEPGPVVPPGPPPPNAGDAAAARFIFRQATAGCITNRVPRLNFSGTNIRAVRVFVNGQLRRNLNLLTLQRRVTPRVTLPPGRYRVTARVAFQRGAGTPPVTFTRVVRVCAAAQPRYTG